MRNQTEQSLPKVLGYILVSLLIPDFGGPYRDRTDDIHGVNVTLYQLS